MGSGYLLAAYEPGVPVKDACVTVNVPEAGLYRVWVRDRNWLRPHDPYISVDIIDSNLLVDGMYQYEVIVYTHAGSLGTTSGTRYSSLEIKTSPNGSVLETYPAKIYSYSGTMHHYESIGYFYLSED